MNTNTPAQKEAAIQEGERITAADEYFAARTWIMDTNDNRRIFEAGFDRAYALLSKLRAPVADISNADLLEAATTCAQKRELHDPLWKFDDLGLSMFISRIRGLQAALASAPVAGEAVTYLGADVAERLDSMADDQRPGSQAQSDLYAAATIWRKHIAHRAAPQASTVAGEPLATMIEELSELASDMAYEANQEMDQEKATRAAIIERGERALRRIAGAAPRASEAVDRSQNLQGTSVDRSAELQGNSDADIPASEDVALPPLPPLPEHRGHAMFAGSQMLTYARAAVLADRQLDAIAWESTTPAYIKFITDCRYRKFSPAVRKWYRPYRCSTCAALSAQPGAQKGDTNG